MKLLKWIFSVENSENKTHKVVTILGIKFKLRRKHIDTYNNIDLNAPVNNFGIINHNSDVVVLGNGPSLKDTFSNKEKFDFIKSKDIFIVNSFVVDSLFYELKPKYLCFMDPKFWARKRSANIKESHDQILDKLMKVNWALTIFMPKEAKEYNVFKDLSNQNNYIKFVYINTSCNKVENKEVLYAMYKQNIEMPIVQNVLISCLYIAINLGYKNIFLFGADNSWHLSLIVNNDNVPSVIQQHFYDNDKVLSKPMYKDAEEKIPFKMSDILGEWVRNHEMYEILDDYSKYMGAKIYNLSEFSCIDAFDRKFNIQEGSNCNAE